jgi:hypothetical protein
MSDYDITHVPPDVQAALLRLTETLIAAWTPARPRTTREAPPDPGMRGESTRLPAIRPAALAPVATPAPYAPCAHGSPERPCCGTCATMQDAEGMVLHAEHQDAYVFSRGSLELAIFHALRQLFPMPLTPRQIAGLVGRERTEMYAVCSALLALGTIARPIGGLSNINPFDRRLLRPAMVCWHRGEPPHRQGQGGHRTAGTATPRAAGGATEGADPAQGARQEERAAGFGNGGSIVLVLLVLLVLVLLVLMVLLRGRMQCRRGQQAQPQHTHSKEPKRHDSPPCRLCPPYERTIV